MEHFPFSVLLVNNFKCSGLKELIVYLDQTLVNLTQVTRIPDDLEPYKVIILDPFELNGKEVLTLNQFVAAGGGCRPGAGRSARRLVPYPG